MNTKKKKKPTNARELRLLLGLNLREIAEMIDIPDWNVIAQIERPRLSRVPENIPFGEKELFQMYKGLTNSLVFRVMFTDESCTIEPLYGNKSSIDIPARYYNVSPKPYEASIVAIQFMQKEGFNVLGKNLISNSLEELVEKLNKIGYEAYLFTNKIVILKRAKKK